MRQKQNKNEKDLKEHIRNRVYIDENGCWNWDGNISNGGYARSTINSHFWLVHRLTYSLYKGNISRGRHIDHLCRNRKCVNPEHLEEVSVIENMLRRDIANGAHRNINECFKGHPFTDENTYLKKRFLKTELRYVEDKVCRECHRLQEIKRRLKKIDTPTKIHMFNRGPHTLERRRNISIAMTGKTKKNSIFSGGWRIKTKELPKSTCLSCGERYIDVLGCLLCKRDLLHKQKRNRKI